MELKFDYQSVPYNFAHCFNDGCTAKDTCLHYQVGRLLPSDRNTVSAVNPRYITRDELVCPLFKPAERMRFALGFTHIFKRLPLEDATDIKRQMLGHFGRNTYYRLRRKEHHLSIEDEAYIRMLFRNYGIAEEPKFDTYVEEYDW